MTAYSSVDDAVLMIQEGAHDYLTKPLDFDRLRLALERAVDHRQVTEKRQQPSKERREVETAIIGQSPKMLELLEMISYVAPTEATVLIYGESGTGKELVARSIHFHSNRNKGPLVKVDCTSLPDELLESEIFGYQKGAFTDAYKDKPGRLEMANGGTLFVDEIGDISFSLQVKFLQVFEEKEFSRLGSTTQKIIDTRVVAATNADLWQKVQDGKFRNDLFYRLNINSADMQIQSAHLQV